MRYKLLIVLMLVGCAVETIKEPVVEELPSTDDQYLSFSRKQVMSELNELERMLGNPEILEGDIIEQEDGDIIYRFSYPDETGMVEFFERENKVVSATFSATSQKDLGSFHYTRITQFIDATVPSINNTMDWVLDQVIMTSSAAKNGIGAEGMVLGSTCRRIHGVSIEFSLLPPMFVPERQHKKVMLTDSVTVGSDCEPSLSDYLLESSV